MSFGLLFGPKRGGPIRLFLDRFLSKNAFFMGQFYRVKKNALFSRNRPKLGIFGPKTEKRAKKDPKNGRKRPQKRALFGPRIRAIWAFGLFLWGPKIEGGPFLGSGGSGVPYRGPPRAGPDPFLGSVLGVIFDQVGVRSKNPYPKTTNNKNGLSKKDGFLSK